MLCFVCLYVTGKFKQRINLVNIKGKCGSQSMYPILLVANFAIKNIISVSHSGALWHTFHKVINSSSHNWCPMTWCWGDSCNGKKHSKVLRVVYIVVLSRGQNVGLSSSNISCVAFNCRNNIDKYKISYALQKLKKKEKCPFLWKNKYSYGEININRANHAM